MAHQRNDSGVSVHSFIVHENPPSPTLTNPDMIMPIPPWQQDPSFEDEGPHPLLEPEIPLSQTASNTSSSTTRSSKEVLGVATAVTVPNRLTARPPTTMQGSITPIPTYMGYEHGAPLSDIYEESEATATPKSVNTIRERERSPSPTYAEETPTRPSLRHKKRLSELSSSSGGSDVGDWENFDSSKVLSSRAAADLARLKGEDTLDVESDATSKRRSREEEELAALNARAEKILEHARKRLTHMEDNLKVARNSIIMPARSPNLGGEHQPVGGLYRSISAAGASKVKNGQRILPIRTSASLQHMRGVSETGVPSPNRRFSKTPDVRSASAMDSSPGRYSLFPDANTPQKAQVSPVSTRSFNSPLRPLVEERASPSTAQTTPESVKLPPVRGLGIHHLATVSRDDLATMAEQPSARQTPPPTLQRASSAASTRSTKELKDQMTDLKSRIADLKNKAAAEHLKRRSLQSLRSSSPFTNDSAEQWYASSPAYKDISPINAGAGVGWKSPTQTKFARSELDVDRAHSLPITPANARFLDVDQMTPDMEVRLVSSARTDRNTPTLARKRDAVEDEEEDDDMSSVIQPHSRYEDASDELEEHSQEYAEPIAENEEEQVYLNEVLEESLRDAENEPEVPAIPGSFLEDREFDGAERHEDRLDAFDYENMFLHSAMGTYTGKSLNGSESGSEDSDDDGSVETSRAEARTPADLDELDEVEPMTDEEMEDAIEVKTPTYESQHTETEKHLRSPPRIDLPNPPKPWTHARSKSVESVSTSATFETATEGDSYDETPGDIFNWNPVPSSSLGYSPTSHQAYRGQASPARSRHGFSSPQGGGRSTVQTNSPIQHYKPVHTLASPGLGLGVVGAENAQYIDDSGVPQRFQGQPSPTGSRQSSAATANNRFRPDSQATVVAASPAKDHTRQISSFAKVSTLTPDRGTPVVVTVTSSPQRKVVINRSLQRPESYVLEPQMSNPPDGPLPAPPASSAALQAQMASPKKIDVKKRAGSAQKRTPAPHQPRTPPSVRHGPELMEAVPNTEILMESLIKLADPSFTLAPGIRFDGVDKNLVLGLLGAVGGVCNSILRASVQSGSPAMGRTQADDMVHRLRQRLEGAAHVLEGRDEERRVTTSRQGLRIKEV